MPQITGYAQPIGKGDAELLRVARLKLAAGQEFRQRTREENWRQSERQYEGRHYAAELSDDPTADLIVVNLSFSTVRTIIPFVTAEEPQFLVEPYSVDASIKNARLQQAWLNRVWRAQRTGAQDALRSAVFDAIVLGDGYLKAVYEIRDKQVSPDAFAEVAEVFVDRVSPWDVWVDPTADGIHNARWTCQRLYTTKRELETDAGRLEDGAPFTPRQVADLPVGNFTGVSEADAEDDATQRRAKDGEDWVVLFEFYDLVTRTMLTFASSGDLPLRKVTEIEPPVVQLGSHPLPRSPYHMGDLEQIWSLQQELNKSRSQLVTHRRRNIAKHFIRKSALTEEAIAALASPVVNEAVPIDGDMPLDSLVKPLQQTPLAAEAYASADQSIRDIFEVTGVNEYQRGAQPEIRRTATEASIIEGASNVKTRDKLAMVERAVRRVGVLLLAIAKEVFPQTDTDEMGLFLTGDDAKQVLRADFGEQAGSALDQGDIFGALGFAAATQTNQDANFYPTEDVFIGEYEVLVETNSTELRNPVFREQKFREMAQLLVSMAPMLSQMGVQLNIRKVLELWFEAAGITDIEGILSGGGLPPAPEPQPGVSGAAGPNLGSAQPPLGFLDAGNSGQFGPA